MNEREILDHLIQSARDDLDYYANPNKPERERWIVGEFLSILAIQHQADELLSLEQRNKADVRFREAFFQVKELTDPNLRRNKMYKDIYNSLKTAKTLDEVSLIGNVSDIPPIANMYDLVVEKATELAYRKQYQQSKAELDLLIYVTRTRASLIQPYELDAGTFVDLGWRSISCVNAKQAIVLFSSSSAPKFLQERLQIIMSTSP